MKILVTTDFSTNSKAGLRYAITLAKLNKAQLIFFHSYFLMKPTSWSDATYLNYANNEKQKLLNSLNKFVAAVYKSMKVHSAKFKCAMEQCIVPESGIMDYAKTHAIDLICISTRGAGSLKKFFGTTAGNLITKSQVPVVAVPQHYKTKNITHILYASDLNNYKEELKKVIAFAKPLKASIEFFHLSSPEEKLINKNKMEATLKKKFKYNIKLHFKNTDFTLPLAVNLQKSIASTKPSVVVMFTEQRRTFFQKLLLSSASESIVYQVNTPLLIFNKTT